MTAGHRKRRMWVDAVKHYSHRAAAAVCVCVCVCVCESEREVLKVGIACDS